MPGTLCPECENINELPKYDFVINADGTKTKWQICRYCDSGIKPV